MNHPDQLSREYAAILPALKDHGYRADVKASIADERFILVVSGKPTTRIYRDGGWVRDDGARGSTPADLLRVYPRVCGVDSLVFNVFNAMRGLFMQIAYLFSGRIVFGFRRSGH